MISPLARRRFCLYGSSLLLYSLALLLFFYGHYYQQFLHPLTLKVLISVFLTYTFLAPFYYRYYATENTENKPFLFLRACLRYLHQLPTTRPRYRWEPKEKIAALFLVVKLFYLPLMLNFLVYHLRDIWSFLHNPPSLTAYSLLLTLIFTLDTFIFTFGYTIELPQLNNVVKSVEPTFLGWVVTLVCYPPFNSWVGDYILWGANDFAEFGTPGGTTLARMLIIFLLIIYVSASITLGTKASNLTNRGIVTRFPYSLIRHPAYTTKVLVWWLTLLPVLNIYFALGMLLWTLIYYLRAVTEERHLLNDSEYLTYCQKVKYRFIPGVV